MEEPHKRPCTCVCLIPKPYKTSSWVKETGGEASAGRALRTLWPVIDGDLNMWHAVSSELRWRSAICFSCTDPSGPDLWVAQAPVPPQTGGRISSQGRQSRGGWGNCLQLPNGVGRPPSRWRKRCSHSFDKYWFQGTHHSGIGFRKADFSHPLEFPTVPLLSWKPVKYPHGNFGQQYSIMGNISTPSGNTDRGNPIPALRCRSASIKSKKYLILILGSSPIYHLSLDVVPNWQWGWWILELWAHTPTILVNTTLCCVVMVTPPSLQPTPSLLSLQYENVVFRGNLGSRHAAF